MSVWDFVAAASISTNINDPSSKSAKVLKKINSATLSVLNGDSIGYVSGGGRTTNTFGASTSFICDIEALLEGWIAGAFHADPLSKTSLILGGLLLGPGAQNNILMGNNTTLTYMPHHSSNFTVIRGGSPESFIHSGWHDTCKCIEISATLYALTVFGFDLLYNLAGTFKAQLMSPVGDSKYISEQKVKVKVKEMKLAELEEAEAKQKKEKQQREASGNVPSHEEVEAEHAAEHAAEQQKEDLESDISELEDTLKTAERQKEWLLWANVILQNRGVYLLKILEKTFASLEKAKYAVTNAEKKIEELQKKLNETTAELTKQTAALSTAPNQPTENAIKQTIAELEKTKAETETQLTEAQNTLTAARLTLANIDK
ncbi:MAG: hypothetical protein ACKOS8_15955 [Gemmataceae bacterium]